MKTNLKALWKHDSGDDIAEYALLLAMIVLVVLVAVYSFGTSNGKSYNDAATTLSTASSGGGSGSSAGGSAGSGQGGGGGSGSGQPGSGGQGGGSSGGSGGSAGGGSGGTKPISPVPVK
ncbi:MAG: hypothetical protein WAU89_19095 [Candidatus Acidiferrales bacterium]